MIQYAGIYLKKQSAEYVRTLNVSDAVHIIRSLYNLLSSYRDRDVFRTLSTFKRERFAKRRMPECRCATRNFTWQERGYGEGGGKRWVCGTRAL